MNTLRNYIREVIIESKKEKKSAGVVIVKKFDKEWRVLILKDKKGRFDITKGLLEDGETFFQGAVREALEESGIFLDEDNFIWGKDSFSYGKGKAFVAATEQTPFILPNPETGEFEHVDWAWLDFKDAKNNVIDYLRPSVEWAESMIFSGKARN